MTTITETPLFLTTNDWLLLVLFGIALGLFIYMYLHGLKLQKKDKARHEH